MKKIIILSLATFVFSSAIFAAPEKMRVVGSWAHLTMFSEFEKPYWKKIFKNEFPNTRTRVSSISQVKLKGAAVYRELANGSFDVVSTVGGYIVSDSQALAGLDLPAIAPDIKTAKKIVEAYKPTLEKIVLRDFNAKLLGVTPYPAQVLFCNEKIDSLEDLKGKKVRAGSWTLAEYLDGLGATGVTPPFSEIASALQRGVLDCAIGGSLSGYSSGWGDIAKYLYPIPVGGWAYVLTSMNLNTWNKFSKEEQDKLLISYNKDVVQPVWDKSNFESIEGVKCLTGRDCSYGKSYNMKVVKFKGKDLSISKRILEERVLPKWAEKVSPETVEEWNNSIGNITNLKIK